jgi:hypothetical protein
VQDKMSVVVGSTGPIFDDSMSRGYLMLMPVDTQGRAGYAEYAAHFCCPLELICPAGPALLRWTGPISRV